VPDGTREPRRSRDGAARDGAAGDGAARDGASRDADLAGIDALIDRLVPALTAKLSSTHLGELEVRDGDWHIRLRRPPSAGWNGELRRQSDRPGRAQPGHETHGHPRAAVEAHRVPTPGGSNGTGASTGSGHASGAGSGTHVGAAAAGTSSHGFAPRPSHEDEGRRVATSPAVGVFRPSARTVVGSRVRSGDTLGHIDVLGVQEEVPAPADGLVGELLVDAGTAVEYGQELIVVAIAAPAEAAR
jgi:glutaconyl-CoA/methylmalonyl-CoA decarboxylase subunit gamma